MTTSEQAYRVADREGEGWLRNGPDGTYTTSPRRDLGSTRWSYTFTAATA